MTDKVVNWNNETSNNLSWIEGDKWYGWTYNPELKRYYFFDFGYESLIDLWEEQWSAEESKQICYNRDMTSNLLCGSSFGTNLFIKHVCGNCNLDKCHYCDAKALYNQAIEYAIIGVCKQHFVQEATS